eukprot:744653-Rhodomonas_salina.2
MGCAVCELMGCAVCELMACDVEECCMRKNCTSNQSHVFVRALCELMACALCELMACALCELMACAVWNAGTKEGGDPEQSR